MRADKTLHYKRFRYLIEDYVSESETRERWTCVLVKHESCVRLTSCFRQLGRVRK